MSVSMTRIEKNGGEIFPILNTTFNRAII